eukprot:GHVL01019657.1.p1 GENE.GHVL01019657.1~~GHVL01019657.1.p1  ORF type:complete len:378 (+),score=113.06 GHVL01019657.1:27-1136(+)
MIKFLLKSPKKFVDSLDEKNIKNIILPNYISSNIIIYISDEIINNNKFQKNTVKKLLELLKEKNNNILYDHIQIYINENNIISKKRLQKIFIYYSYNTVEKAIFSKHLLKNNLIKKQDLISVLLTQNLTGVQLGDFIGTLSDNSSIFWTFSENVKLVRDIYNPRSEHLQDVSTFTQIARMIERLVRVYKWDERKACILLSCLRSIGYKNIETLVIELKKYFKPTKLKHVVAAANLSTDDLTELCLLLTDYSMKDAMKICGVKIDDDQLITQDPVNRSLIFQAILLSKEQPELNNFDLNNENNKTNVLLTKNETNDLLAKNEFDFILSNQLSTGLYKNEKKMIKNEKKMIDGDNREEFKMPEFYIEEKNQ